MEAQFNIHEAKTHFSKLIERVEAGEDVVIGRAGKPVAKLVPIKSQTQKRKFGQLKGKIWMADDFNETPQEIIDSFYNSEIFPTDSE